MSTATATTAPAHRVPTATSDVVIVGSGFSGLGAAIQLARAGIDDVVILERGDRLGGTWRDNHYPGAACDIPAHLYSFSFAPKADWTTHYPRQPEIQAYLEQLAADHDLGRRVVLDTPVASMAYDDDTATWTVTATDGRAWRARTVVNATGALSDPAYPDVPGRERFAGAQFHSADWDHDVDLDGVRVGVVGTGASSIQFVPHLAERAAHLTVFQRSAAWVIPRIDRRYTRLERWAFRHVPGLRALYRTLIYWQKELRFLGFRKGSVGMRLMERLARWHLRRSVADPAKRAVLTPDYEMGCKRILISDDYYRAMGRDDVTVETAGIAEVVPDGVVLRDGRRVALDVLVWGTGFAVADPLGGMEVTGRGGRSLREVWDPHPFAYLGTTVPGFPNLFLMTGPNTGLGHNSMVHVMESQYPYVVAAIRRVATGEVAALEPRADVTEAYQRELVERHAGLVWASGCRSWYLGEDGHNFTLWPGFTFELRRRLRNLRLDDLRVEPVTAGGPAGAVGTVAPAAGAAGEA